MHIYQTDLQETLQYALSKNTAIRANRANGSKKALVLQKKYFENRLNAPKHTDKFTPQHLNK